MLAIVGCRNGPLEQVLVSRKRNARGGLLELTSYNIRDTRLTGFQDIAS